MGEKTVELGAGTLYIDDLVVPINSGLTTTEEELNDTAFPLKLSPSEYMGTINDLYAKGLLLGMIEQIRARALYIRASIESNNWRKMHGYPMRRKMFRTRRKWIKWVRGYLAEQNIEYVERKLNNRRRFK